ncbi:helix-turn-helix domain-containing protein [Nocardiopsis exhalans]|uniref:Helix-turn-helix domain-containing protein n=1 Tax=Nocardiopsis exhalans TaxID=163604 RepID=A0ABY5CZY6_9ACTN|nr:helix-turn-helix transcriptional regulator [Nocardiopsis exhalans]USY17459.1 helix-turn-helix domain-containing protein [Nocardiopsis exhalans]
MPPNERLRICLEQSGHTAASLAARVGTDPKTVARWISTGRVPHRRNAHAVARALGEDVFHLWPELEGTGNGPATASEVVRVYPDRGSVPAGLWYELLETAKENVDVLVYAGLFLSDNRASLPRLLERKAEEGLCVRILLGDPDSEAVARRGGEEGVGSAMAARIDLATASLGSVFTRRGITVRLHGTTLYNSLFRFDDNLLVNAHVYGFPAAHNPVMHLRRTPEPGLFGHYMSSFAKVWELGTPASREKRS